MFVGSLFNEEEEAIILDPSAMSQPARRRTRRALVLVLRDENRDQAAGLMEEIDKLYVAREEIPTLLNDALSHLEAVTRQTFPRIIVDFQKRPSEGISFEKVLARLDNRAEFRLIASISPSANNINTNPPALHKLGISHLVTVSFSNSLPPGWRSDSGIGSANVVTTPDRIFHLIVDLMLDIAMFHQAAKKMRALSPAEKVVLSRLKALYALKHSLASYYGPIHDSTLEYFCFASNVRRGEEFSDDDCKKYEELWHHFFSTEVLPLVSYQGSMKSEPTRRVFPNVPMGDKTFETIVHMLDRKRVGQISTKELKKALSVLQPGKYHLLLATSKPPRERQRERLLYLFAKSKWRSNLWVILPANLLPESVLQSPFIESIPFTLG